MTPLTSWTCDTCGDQITDPDEGLVTWPSSGPIGDRFRVVHKSTDGRACDPRAGTACAELSSFLGPDGQERLLWFLSAGPLTRTDPGAEAVGSRTDLDGFVDLFRRLQRAWYEEARSKFDHGNVRPAVWSAVPENEWARLYTPPVLERIATDAL